MKKIIATSISLLLFIPLLSYAEESKKIDPIEVCSTFEELAGLIMEHRQLGTPMSKIMKILGSDKIGRKIVVDAYEETRFSTESYQKKSIENFKNKWFLSCFKGLSKQKNE